MTAPGWIPTPNPGGQNRRLLRNAAADWIEACHIPGVDAIHRSMPPEIMWEHIARTGGVNYSCQLAIRSPRRTRERLTYTGPEAVDGVLYHADIELAVFHRSYLVGSWDFERDEDDYDRIIDALYDALSGTGRCLGRPDVFLAVGEYPRESGITDVHAEPAVALDGSAIDRWGVLALQASFYPSDQSGGS